MPFLPPVAPIWCQVVPSDAAGLWNARAHLGRTGRSPARRVRRGSCWSEGLAAAMAAPTWAAAGGSVGGGSDPRTPRRGTRSGPLPWVLLLIGSTASLAANVAVPEPTLYGRVIAAWPSLALIGAYELLMRQIRLSTADERMPDVNLGTVQIVHSHAG